MKAAQRIKFILEIAFEKRAFINNLKVSLIVGIILNGINQGREIVGLEFSSINYLKFLLTFLVPFLVSLYASTLTKMKFITGDISPAHLKLICSRCNQTFCEVEKSEKINECPNCREQTNWKVFD